jgi:acyl carrier protein
VAPDVVRRPPPIGRPITGVRAYVLGARLEPVPLACPGEVCLTGAGLARGYLGRPDATAEQFVPDPRGEPGGRLYRTGDLGRFLPDGSIEFLGRADAQVKIRGFRIEPGEIEAVLRGQPGVAEAVVEARTGPGGEARLVAWVAGPAERRPGDGELREAIRRALPAYMIPDLFVLLDGMPLSPNGKVDRHALSAPDWRRTGTGARVAPRSQVERMLAAIWAELLEIDEVGVFDNFFELGGHSLKAGRLVRRIQDTFGVEVPLRSLFEAPTVASLSVEIARQLVRRADPKALTRALNEVKSMGGTV